MGCPYSVPEDGATDQQSNSEANDGTTGQAIVLTAGRTLAYARFGRSFAFGRALAGWFATRLTLWFVARFGLRLARRFTTRFET